VTFGGRLEGDRAVPERREKLGARAVAPAIGAFAAHPDEGGGLRHAAAARELVEEAQQCLQSVESGHCRSDVAASFHRAATLLNPALHA
jgi:hypothetical protein